ncbi:MAG: XRE family transcriptional regulator [Bacteroidales bacterium]|nr:XRE family transcriptional regulator [Bacteroidales bacterium]
MHIGEEIKKELQRQERTASWLARRINCDRTNVYDIFKRKTIDTELLLAISMVLRVDFFARYSENLSASSSTDGAE